MLSNIVAIPHNVNSYYSSTSWYTFDMYTKMFTILPKGSRLHYEEVT